MSTLYSRLIQVSFNTQCVSFCQLDDYTIQYKYMYDFEIQILRDHSAFTWVIFMILEKTNPT